MGMQTKVDAHLIQKRKKDMNTELGKNIFITGREVQGDSMIGYERHLTKLTRELVENDNNISVTGIKKFGKTSLVKEVLRRVKKEYEGKLIILTMDLAKRDSFQQVLKQMGIALRIAVMGCPELKEDSLIKEYINLLLSTDPDVNMISYENYLEGTFQLLHTMDYKVILMIDEFDRAGEIFPGTSEYEFFRDLSANSDSGVLLVLISRRQLYMIEKKNINNSTFHGIMKTYVIHGFDDSDLEEYFSVLENRYKIKLTEKQIEQLKYYAGKSPYMWSLIGFSMVEEFRKGNRLDVEKLYQDNTIDIENYYKSIYANLANDKIEVDGALTENCSIEKLMGAVIGPIIDLTTNDIDYLVSMGYLCTRNERRYAISGHFTAYLRQKNYKADSWKHIISLEKKLKALIRKEIQKSIGEREVAYSDWEHYMELAGIDGALDTYDKFIENSIKDFHHDVDILDVMGLDVAITLMKYNWEQMFSQYFEWDGFHKWEGKLRMIAKGRNPMAHGHEEFLTAEEKNCINSYCIEIMKCLQKNDACEESSVHEKKLKNEKRLEFQNTYYSLNELYPVKAEMENSIIDFYSAIQNRKGVKGYLFFDEKPYKASISKAKWIVKGLNPSESLGTVLKVKINSINLANNTMGLEFI